MKLTQQAVELALYVTDGGKVSAKMCLRDDGYKFRDSTFSDMCSTFEAEASPEPTPPTGVLEAPDVRRETTNAKTLVFTSAQSCTDLNTPFFDALLNYCEARGAELHISQFTYNKANYGKNSVKPGTAESTDQDDIWFDPRIKPYVSDESLEITPDLIFCGEVNISPTSTAPLTRFKNYTRKASGIIPHAKMCMDSVPTMKNNPAKFLYTTGTVTARNYIQKAAGQIADFHHVFGALVVEVDDNGTWWARQLNADKTGGFFDLTAYWGPNGSVVPPRRVAAITHGDIHYDKLDMQVAKAVWEEGGVVDDLRPKEQHFHDTVDFMPRNHHNIKDPHFVHEMFVLNTGSVEREFKNAAAFLATSATREWADDVLIVSNHDQAINLWLNNTAAIMDPVNARYWFAMNHYAFDQRERGEKPHMFEHAMRMHMPEGYECKFVHEDDSHLILDEIEAGLHGHLGANGSRGSPRALRTVGKANTAHTHSAGITEGIYTCGVYGKLDMGYNKGLSSWSHSMIVTYANAKRAILTIKDGKAWR